MIQRIMSLLRQLCSSMSPCVLETFLKYAKGLVERRLLARIVLGEAHIPLTSKHYRAPMLNLIKILGVEAHITTLSGSFPRTSSRTGANSPELTIGASSASPRSAQTSATQFKSGPRALGLKAKAAVDEKEEVSGGDGKHAHPDATDPGNDVGMKERETARCVSLCMEFERLIDSNQPSATFVVDIGNGRTWSRPEPAYYLIVHFFLRFHIIGGKITPPGSNIVYDRAGGLYMSPLNSPATRHKAIVVSENPHNPPMNPTSKPSTEEKLKLKTAVNAASLNGLTVQKLLNAPSTLNVYEGKCVADNSPAFEDTREV
ncbi:hypothetical protein B0H13DRAFT_1889203 [Mycena leptocephala]|nr:hypothetical protein B0H13DRAFT_1889203 [Mycena leptocephala]